MRKLLLLSILLLPMLLLSEDKEVPTLAEVDQLRIDNVLLDLRRIDAEVRTRQANIRILQDEIAVLQNQQNSGNRAFLELLDKTLGNYDPTKANLDWERDGNGSVLTPVRLVRKPKPPQ